MFQRGGEIRRRLRPTGRLGAAIALLALAFALGGCGNCGGWTNPWAPASLPHSCGSDQPSQGSAMLHLGE
jgi:hypothetical protein